MSNSKMAYEMFCVALFFCQHPWIKIEICSIYGQMIFVRFSAF